MSCHVTSFSYFSLLSGASWHSKSGFLILLPPGIGLGCGCYILGSGSYKSWRGVWDQEIDLHVMSVEYQYEHGIVSISLREMCLHLFADLLEYMRIASIYFPDRVNHYQLQISSCHCGELPVVNCYYCRACMSPSSVSHAKTHKKITSIKKNLIRSWGTGARK